MQFYCTNGWFKNMHLPCVGEKGEEETCVEGGGEEEGSGEAENPGLNSAA